MTGEAALVDPVGGLVAALAVTAPPRAHMIDAPAARPMTGLDLLMVPSVPIRRNKRVPPHRLTTRPSKARTRAQREPAALMRNQQHSTERSENFQEVTGRSTRSQVRNVC